MILFCLPYAGGSAAIYYKWEDYFCSKIKVIPIELRGRGGRYDENLYEEFNEAIDDIYEIIKDKIKEDDYAIFGHSFGSLLGYELYYKIKDRGDNIPKHMFFSGARAPECVRGSGISTDLPDLEFMSKVCELGGTAEEILKNKELIEIFAPILKSDFRLIDEYRYNERKNKLECDISTINGDKDVFGKKEIELWGNYTNGKYNNYMIDGTHFFIIDKGEEVTRLIEKNLF